MEIKRAATASLVLLWLSQLYAGAGDRSLAAKRDKVENLRREAAVRYREGDYDRAILRYRELLTLVPSDKRVLKDLMWAYWEMRRFEEAAGTAREIAALYPGDREAIDMLARVPSGESREAVLSLCRKAGYRAPKSEVVDIIALYRRFRALLPEDSTLAEHLLSGLLRMERFEEGALLAAHLTKLQPWNAGHYTWLGTMESGCGNGEAAVKAYRRSLEINPNQAAVRLLLGRELVAVRDFDRALEELLPLEDDSGSMPQLYPLLAKALFWKQRFAESVPRWERSVRLFPDKTSYRYYEAQALYYSRQTEEALEKLAALYRDNGHEGAFNLMVDITLARRDMQGAEKMLENALQTLTARDEGRVMRLETLYALNEQTQKLELLVERFLDIWPDNPLLLEVKAGYLFSANRYAEALQAHEKVLRINPAHVDALIGIANCRMKLGAYSSALEANKKLTDRDPANPYHACREAQLRFLLGEHESAKQILVRWLEQNKDYPVLPIVLYHGLTPFHDDPIISYTYHHTIDTFEDHLRALRDAGYTPVVDSQVAAWYNDRVPLPQKPVMIAFDDGRRDSFVYGDPLLEKYGFKATMFAAVVNMEGHRPPGYVSWETMRAYRDTGRWEIQSHGDLAHITVPSSPDGRSGLFLINRRWIENEGRFETIGEWRKRVTDDYESSKAKIAEHIGQTPCGFAFPQGYYGQDGNCNSPEAASINVEAAKSFFTTLYVQDGSGINMGSRDPALLCRFIPENHLTGKDLLAHFERNNPVNLVYMQLVDLAVYEKRYRDVVYWLDRWEKNGVSRAAVLAKKSELYFDRGNIVRSRRLAREALALEYTPHMEKIAGHRERREWDGEYYFMEDNSRRRKWAVNTTLNAGRTGLLEWSLRQKHGEYRQGDYAGVIDDAAGAAASLPLGLFHRFSAGILAHRLSGSARSTWSASGTMQSSWPHGFDSRVEAGRSLYDSASALNANVTSVYGDTAVTWSGGRWSAGLWQFFGNLSDGNSRRTFTLEARRELAFSGALRAVCRSAYDSMEEENPSYYCPRSLFRNGAGLELRSGREAGSGSRRLEWYLLYMPSYAREQGVRDDLTHDAEVSVMISGDRFSLKPSFSYYETASYNEQYYMAEVMIRF